MAEAAIVEMPVNAARKSKNSRKALKQKNPSSNEANILAQKLSAEPSPVPVPPSAEANPNKENVQGLPSPKKGKSKSKSKSKAKQQQENESPQQQDFERELQAMQEMMEKLKIEKEKTEELLKEKDEILKRKDEELKKLHRLKEFKPSVVSSRLSHYNSIEDYPCPFDRKNVFYVVFIRLMILLVSFVVSVPPDCSKHERQGTGQEGEEEGLPWN